jgi:hypothetical protein
MSDRQMELDRILDDADPALAEMVRAYEPLEDQYRSAYSSDQVYPTASDTSAVPYSLTFASENTL